MTKIKINEDNINKLFFTSDQHYYHKNIISYCNRPFQDEFYMNDNLIDNWNSIVPKDGIVIDGGDFAFTGNIKHIKELNDKLNGTIYRCLGNHCYQNKHDRQIIKNIFDNRVYDVIDLTVFDDELDGGHVNFFISHYPHLFWKRGAFHLHGHVHSGPRSTSNELVPYHDRRYDIGVDNNDYKPVSYTDLKILFTKRLGGFK